MHTMVKFKANDLEHYQKHRLAHNQNDKGVNARDDVRLLYDESIDKLFIVTTKVLL